MGACQNIGRVFYLRGGFNTPTLCVEVADCIFFNLKSSKMSKIQERKTTQKIVFKDSMGNPLANSKVEFSLSKHEFLFGCNGFLAADLVNQLGEENAEGNENVRQFLDVFNFATLPFFHILEGACIQILKLKFFPLWTLLSSFGFLEL